MVTIQDIANKSGVAIQRFRARWLIHRKLVLKQRNVLKKLHKIWAIRQILLQGT